MEAIVIPILLKGGESLLQWICNPKNWIYIGVGLIALLILVLALIVHHDDKTIVAQEAQGLAAQGTADVAKGDAQAATAAATITAQAASSDAGDQTMIQPAFNCSSLVPAHLSHPVQSTPVPAPDVDASGLWSALDDQTSRLDQAKPTAPTRWRSSSGARRPRLRPSLRRSRKSTGGGRFRLTSNPIAASPLAFGLGAFFVVLRPFWGHFWGNAGDDAL